MTELQKKQWTKGTSRASAFPVMPWGNAPVPFHLCSENFCIERYPH